LMYCRTFVAYPTLSGITFRWMAILMQVGTP